MKSFKFVLFFFFIISCTEKYTTIDEYSKDSIKYVKTKITISTKDFSISIPKNWKWKEIKNETKYDMLGIIVKNVDTIPDYSKIMVFKKYKSFEKNTDLKTEYESLLKNNKESNQPNKIVECGKTNLLKYDAFFVHMVSQDEKPFEQILIIIKSKEMGVFYSLNSACDLEDNLKPSMSMMLECMRSFEYN